MAAVAFAMLSVTGPARAELRVLIVAGLGGEAEYETKFQEQAQRIAEATAKAAGGKQRVTVLTGDKARKNALEGELRELAERAKREDQVAIVLIGHGSYDGDVYRFNLPGPDITGGELAKLFDRLPASQQLIVNSTSASGAVIESWQRPNRVVVTATRSGSERNATRFAEFWAQALSSGEADRDKNEIVTANEAFEFASRKVADMFKADTSLATEHARIEGTNAARFLVARLGEAPMLPDDPVLAGLLAQQSDVERRLDELKSRKATLDRELYYRELEKVLVAMATLDRSIDRRRATLGGTQPRTPDAPTNP
jgi:hypothetical protein